MCCKKNKFKFLFSICIFATIQCTVKQATIFDIQGHRGCRGLMPENTIPAFEKAFVLGVNTLELDVVVTKDKKILVSHEPYFSSEISTLSDGNFIDSASEKNYNIFQMTYLETQAIDCGLKIHPRFPDQQKIKTTKPLLQDVFKAIDSLSKIENRKIFYNIETKSTLEGDNIYNPEPEELVKLLFDEIKKSGHQNLITIQSFDIRTLQEFKKTHPEITLALLVENNLSVKENIDSLGFLPDIYSPDYHLVTEEMVKFCHNNKIRLIPWTVNNRLDFEKLKSMGVDGIITDYPNLFVNL